MSRRRPRCRPGRHLRVGRARCGGGGGWKSTRSGRLRRPLFPAARSPPRHRRRSDTDHRLQASHRRGHRVPGPARPSERQGLRRFFCLRRGYVSAGAGRCLRAVARRRPCRRDPRGWRPRHRAGRIVLSDARGRCPRCWQAHGISGPRRVRQRGPRPQGVARTRQREGRLRRC